MVTVPRRDGLRIIIFTDDHHPAHFHVFGDGEMKFNLSGAGGRSVLIWAVGTTRSEVRKAMRVVSDHRRILLAHWESIHGRAD